jgi:hypothetical protein
VIVLPIADPHARRWKVDGFWRKEGGEVVSRRNGQSDSKRKPFAGNAPLTISRRDRKPCIAPQSVDGTSQKLTSNICASDGFDYRSPILQTSRTGFDQHLRFEQISAH